MKRFALVALLMSFFVAGCGGGSVAPLDTIEGSWAGTITSSVYDQTGQVNLTVGPENTTADNHTSSLSANGNSLQIFCEKDVSEMQCYRFGGDESILMQGSISGRTWSGTFEFGSATFGRDRGSFRLTKR